MFASLLPNDIILGMEIRAKVTEYVRLRIVAARKEGVHDDKSNHGTTSTTNDSEAKTTTTPQHHYNNCAVMRTNSMKFLPNYFPRQSISKLFFCFPDPHFKRKNHPRRIVAARLLDEYAFVLKDDGGGRLYCITDVRELHDWHVLACDAHPLFARVLVSTDNNGDTSTTAEYDDDPCVDAMQFKTEEGQKVDRNGGSKYYAVYERIADSKAVSVDASNFFG